MHLDKKTLRSIFVLIAGCILFAWLVLDTQRASLMFSTVWDLLSPFVIGAGIAFVFNVPMRAVEGQIAGIRKASARRGMAILMTLLLLIMLIVFVFGLLIPQIQQTVISLSEKLPGFTERVVGNLVALMEEHPSLNTLVREAFNLESLDWTVIAQNILSFLGNWAGTVMGGAVNVIGNVTGAVVDTVIGIAFSIYCLARKEILARQGRRILYSILPETAVDEIIRILRLTNNTFSNFISGQCLEAVILGCLFAVAMAIFKMPYIPLVSVLIAVTALIPVVGAFVGCILGAFFILVDNPLLAAMFVVMFLVIQQLENNLIYPRVVGTSIGLPGMWVLVAVTVGGELMGVGGMLLMIPLASVLYTLLREWTDRRLEVRKIPEEKLRDHPPELKSQFQQNKGRKERLHLKQMKEKLQQLQKEKKK